MSRFATGVTVFTTSGEDTHAMTANAFTSLSLDPPLVLGCVVRDARMHEALGRNRQLGVSILARDQEVIARRFAGRDRVRGWAQFSGLSWWSGQHTGVPILAGAAGWLECRVVEFLPGGDHVVVIAEVLACGEGQHEVLTFVDGSFGGADVPSPVGTPRRADVA